MTDQLQEPTSEVSQPELPSDPSPANDGGISPAAVSIATAGREAAKLVSSDKEGSSGHTQPLEARSDGAPEVPLEVVCDFDEPTHLKVMKWNHGKAELANYFDENGRRVQPGPVYSAIRKPVVLPNYPIRYG